MSGYSSNDSPQSVWRDDVSTDLESAFDRMAICPPSTIRSGPSYTFRDRLPGPPINHNGWKAGVQRRDTSDFIAAEELENELPPSFSTRKYTIAIYQTGSHASATLTPASESTQGPSGTLESFIQSAHFPAITELALLFHNLADPLACRCNDKEFLRLSHAHMRSICSWPDPDALGDAMFLCRDVGERLRKVTIHMCFPQSSLYPTYGIKCLLRRYCPNVQEMDVPEPKYRKLSTLNPETALVEKLRGMTIQC